MHLAPRIRIECATRGLWRGLWRRVAAASMDPRYLVGAAELQGLVPAEVAAWTQASSLLAEAEAARQAAEAALHAAALLFARRHQQCQAAATTVHAAAVAARRRVAHAQQHNSHAALFRMLDAGGALTLVVDHVDENDALCAALACTAMRDALFARFGVRAVAADPTRSLRRAVAAEKRIVTGVAGIGASAGRLAWVRGLGARGPRWVRRWDAETCERLAGLGGLDALQWARAPGYAGSRRLRGSGCVGLCAGPQGRRWRSPRSLRRAEAATRPRAASARDPAAFASALTTMLATPPWRGMAPSDSRLVVRWCLVLSPQGGLTRSRPRPLGRCAGE